MNQDFTVQKKAIFVWKKIHAEGLTWKKIPSQAASEKNKKKFVQAENSPPPPPRITFPMVRPLCLNVTRGTT